MRAWRARAASASAGAIVAVAVAALTVAGCGSSGGTTSAPSAAATATSTTATTSTIPTSTSSTPTSTPTTSSSTSTTASSLTTTPTTTSSSTSTATAQPVAAFTLSSSAFPSGGAIPSTYTCDGSDTSLPLSWSGVPAGTKELVLTMRDPDAPGGSYVHWAVAGIDPTTAGFAAGGVSGMVIPGRNSAGTLGYTGPCPPQGAPHHYVITLSALGSSSGLQPGFSADQLQASALGIATLIGTYSR